MPDLWRRVYRIFLKTRFLVNKCLCKNQEKINQFFVVYCKYILAVPGDDP